MVKQDFAIVIRCSFSSNVIRKQLWFSQLQRVGDLGNSDYDFNVKSGDCPGSLCHIPTAASF